MTIIKLLVTVAIVLLSATKCHDGHNSGTKYIEPYVGPVYTVPCGKKGKECVYVPPVTPVPVPSTLWLFVTALVVLKFIIPSPVDGVRSSKPDVESSILSGGSK